MIGPDDLRPAVLGQNHHLPKLLFVLLQLDIHIIRQPLLDDHTDRAEIIKPVTVLLAALRRGSQCYDQLLLLKNGSQLLDHLRNFLRMSGEIIHPPFCHVNL